MALGPQAPHGKKADERVRAPVTLCATLIDAHVARVPDGSPAPTSRTGDYDHLVYGRDFEADGTVEAVQVRHGDMSPDGSGPSFERGVEIGQVFQLGAQVFQRARPEGA